MGYGRSRSEGRWMGRGERGRERGAFYERRPGSFQEEQEASSSSSFGETGETDGRLRKKDGAPSLWQPRPCCAVSSFFLHAQMATGKGRPPAGRWVMRCSSSSSSSSCRSCARGQAERLADSGRSTRGRQPFQPAARPAQPAPLPWSPAVARGQEVSMISLGPWRSCPSSRREEESQPWSRIEGGSVWVPRAGWPSVALHRRRPAGPFCEAAGGAVGRLRGPKCP